MDERDERTHPGVDDFEDTQVLLPDDLAEGLPIESPPAEGLPAATPPSRPALVRASSVGSRPVTRPPERDTREIVVAARAHWHPAPWLVAGVAAGAGLAGLIWLLVIAFAPSEIDRVPTAPHSQAAAAAPAEVARLRDRRGVIVLHADGTLEGLEGVGPNVRRAVAETLRQATLPAGPGPAAPASTTNSPPAATLAAARPLAPAGVRVLTDQPRFTWSDDPAALDYQVTIVDRLGNVIAASPRLRALAWEPTRPLPRGRPLVWRLDTRVRRGESAPPPAEARFALLAAEDLAWLEREIHAAQDSHLVAAVLTAELGALDDTHTALVELARLNPRAAVVGRLLADLQAKRGR